MKSPALFQFSPVLLQAQSTSMIYEDGEAHIGPNFLSMVVISSKSPEALIATG